MYNNEHIQNDLYLETKTKLANAHTPHVTMDKNITVMTLKVVTLLS